MTAPSFDHSGIRFRLYKNLESSVFDLVDGDLEVQQSKGLGLLLAKDPHFLETFLNLDRIRSVTQRKVKLPHYSEIVVHCEVFSTCGKRIDLAISLYRHGKPDFCLIIEAKSINKKASEKAADQGHNYACNLKFPTLEEFPTKYIFALTRNEIITDDKISGTLTWDDVVHALKDYSPPKASLAYDYFNFITNIRGSMKFYEKEVFSIPAGSSFQHIDQYPHIYECPNTKDYPLGKKSLYVTFRKSGGGEMERLYGLQHLIVLDPSRDLERFRTSNSYQPEVVDRICAYCSAAWGKDYPVGEKQFYVLSIENQITLKHKPRPPRNNPFRAYYRLSDLMNDQKLIVDKESA